MVVGALRRRKSGVHVFLIRLKTIQGLIRTPVNASESSASSRREAIPRAARPPRPDGIPAVLWSPNEDTRLLLRGLLGLLRCPIVGEASTRAELESLDGLPHSTLLVVDATDEVPDWPKDLAAVLKNHLELRALVLVSRPGEDAEARARAAGAAEVVVRPFATEEFVHAVGRASTDPSTARFRASP